MLQKYLIFLLPNYLISWPNKRENFENYSFLFKLSLTVFTQCFYLQVFAVFTLSASLASDYAVQTSQKFLHVNNSSPKFIVCTLNHQRSHMSVIRTVPGSCMWWNSWLRSCVIVMMGLETFSETKKMRFDKNEVLKHVAALYLDILSLRFINFLFLIGRNLSKKFKGSF